MIKIYLVDGVDYIELDCEDIDFTNIFNVAEVKDLGLRKDNISKTVVFKNTKVNNNAFGNLFHLNRVSSSDLSNKLFYNYNPLRPVNCLVYEDSVLILKGNLRVIKINENGYYETVITGSFIEFMKTINEKFLTDLDLTDLSHRYLPVNISNTWLGNQERMTATGSFYYTNPGATAVPDNFDGKGYVYPYIDYGFTMSATSSFILGYGAYRQDYNKFNILNFKPAVPVREIFDRIFGQTAISGYSYELKGDTDFINKFNSLIIPNNQERIDLKKSGYSHHYSSPYVTIFTVADTNTYYQGSGSGGVKTPIFERGIKLPQFNFVPSGVFQRYIDYDKSGTSSIASYRGLTAAVLYVKRTVTASGQFSVQLNDIINVAGTVPPLSLTQVSIKIQLVERDYIPPSASNYSDTFTWGDVVAESIPLNVPRGVTISSHLFTATINDYKFKEGKQLLLRILAQGNDIGSNYVLQIMRYNIGSADLYIPKDQFSPFEVSASMDIDNPDVIYPVLPTNVKQFDFIKSIINHFNLYVYSDSENPKKLIFERYDDYYALCQPYLLKDASLDWTSKIDLKSINIISNLTIPKTYTFRYKDDSDFYNDFIKKKYERPYGTFRFTDNLGITDEMKVELIFSPTPTVNYSNTGRLIPAIYKVSGNNVEPVKSNIRILHYNGYIDNVSSTICKPWKAQLNTVGYYVKDGVVIPLGSSIDISLDGLFGLTQSGYPMASHYYLNDNNDVTDDLNFGTPDELFFTPDESILNAVTSYQNYYLNQTTDLTDFNLSILECDAYLNEIDIANLDLRVPVFIDLGRMGHSYYKVLSVEYSSKNYKSKLKLQKITIDNSLEVDVHTTTTSTTTTTTTAAPISTTINWIYDSFTDNFNSFEISLNGTPIVTETTSIIESFTGSFTASTGDVIYVESFNDCVDVGGSAFIQTSNPTASVFQFDVTDPYVSVTATYSYVVIGDSSIRGVNDGL